MRAAASVDNGANEKKSQEQRELFVRLFHFCERWLYKGCSTLFIFSLERMNVCGMFVLYHRPSVFPVKSPSWANTFCCRPKGHCLNDR